MRMSIITKHLCLVIPKIKRDFILHSFLISKIQCFSIEDGVARYLKFKGIVLLNSKFLLSISVKDHV